MGFLELKKWQTWFQGEVHPCYHHSKLSTEVRPEGGRERLTNGLKTPYLQFDCINMRIYTQREKKTY
jgi:hypothetical protein